MKKPLMTTVAVLAIGFAATLSPAKAQDMYEDEASLPARMVREVNPRFLTEMDRTFILMAGEGNRKEIDLSRLALERSSSPSVRQFAQRMIDDHTQANDRLKQVAEEYNLLLPLTGGQGSWDFKKRFATGSGTDFDTAYMETMRKDHVRTVEEFELHEKHTRIPEIWEYISATLPVVKQHLQTTMQR